MSQPTFNLWTDPWITVETLDNQLQTVGIEQALLKACDYAGLYDHSAMVEVGIHRLLVAILQDIYNPQSTTALKNIWRARRFSSKAVKGFGEQFGCRFDIYSPNTPFMQSADIPMDGKGVKKAAAKLIPEFDAETSVPYWRKHLDETSIFCSRCMAGGLTLIPSFMPADGGGYRPSINAPGTYYVIPGGRTLFDSLTASLTTPPFQPSLADHGNDLPWWRREPIVNVKGVVLRMGYLHSLTFATRRVRLYPMPMTKPCTACGEQTDWGVRWMHFEMGEYRPKEAVTWIDPFAAYFVDAKKNEEGKVQEKEVKYQKSVKARPERGAWSDYIPLFLSRKGVFKRPLVLDQLEMLGENLLPYGDAPIPFRVVSAQYSNAELREVRDEGFQIQPAFLNNDMVALAVETALFFVETAVSLFNDGFYRALTLQLNGEDSEKLEDRYKQWLPYKQERLHEFWHHMSNLFDEFIIRIHHDGCQDAHKWFIDRVYEYTLNTLFEALQPPIKGLNREFQRINYAENYCREGLSKAYGKQLKSVRSIEDEENGEEVDEVVA